MKQTNRWLVVLGAVLIQICLGAVYAWSLFNKPLSDKFGWETSQVVLTFSITIAMFALATIFAGKLQDKIGPRWVATVGGILLCTGLLLSSTADSLVELYIFYGVIGGIGVGTAYVCPLATCVKWFPDKKGFITGIAVGAFGSGSLIFKSVILKLIEAKGVSETFLYLGIIYGVLIVLGAQLLKAPEKTAAKAGSAKAVDFGTKEMISTVQFYFIWIMFFFGCISGLMVIGLAKDIGTELVKLTPETAANAVAMIALFNAGGRLGWGMISDKLGRVKSFFIMYVMTAVAMIVMSTVTMNFAIFFTCIAAIAMSFGGFLAVYPSITADYYGTKNLGVNYGIVMQAYGIAAIVGPIVAASLGFKSSFLLSAVLSIVAAVMTFMVKPPVHPSLSTK
ncbi:MAG: L-lactate MFS transporter [Bacillota bacterium]